MRSCRIVLLSICAGLLLWLADAVVDARRAGQEQFIRLPRGKGSDEALVFRSLVVVSFVALGVILSRQMRRREDAEEALRGSEAHYRRLVVLTASSDPTDVAYCHEAGTNTYITKPMEFKKLVELIMVIGNCWLRAAQLPSVAEG